MHDSPPIPSHKNNQSKEQLCLRKGKDYFMIFIEIDGIYLWLGLQFSDVRWLAETVLLNFVVNVFYISRAINGMGNFRLSYALFKWLAWCCKILRYSECWIYRRHYLCFRGWLTELFAQSSNCLMRGGDIDPFLSGRPSTCWVRDEPIDHTPFIVVFIDTISPRWVQFPWILYQH